MDINDQHELERKLKRDLLHTTGVSALCIMAGLSMMVQAFSTNKSRVDKVSFCFNPPVVYEEGEQQRYCRKDQIRRGVEWVIALELEKRPSLNGKIDFLKRHPAKNPAAGLFGLGSFSFFITALFTFKLGTSKLKENLDVVVGIKKKELVLREANRQSDLSLRLQRISNAHQYTTEEESLLHGQMMSMLVSDGEKERIIKEHMKNEEIKDHMHQLQITEAKKLKEKEETERLKQIKEQERLQKKKSKDEEGDDFDLIQLMKDHEGGWIWDLIAPNQFIIIYGNPGSAKSYTAASIAIAQEIIHESKLESIADPDYHQNKNKSWEHLKKLEPLAYGEGKNWEEYGECIDLVFASYADRTQRSPFVTHIWDEIMLLKCELPDRSESFMRTMIASPRKANSCEICITHSLTTEGLPGSEKIMESIKKSSIQLRLKANARKEPLFKGTISGWIDREGNDIEEMSITIPDWFKPDFLIKLWEKKKSSESKNKNKK